MADDDKSAPPPGHGENVRKFTKEVFDISKNVVLIAGLNHFSKETGSTLLWYASYALLVVIALHIHTYIYGSDIGDFVFRKIKKQSRGWMFFAHFCGWLVSLLLSLCLILLIDQTIDRVSNAQANVQPITQVK